MSISFAITNINKGTNVDADADGTDIGADIDCFIFNNNQPD